jgi:hypothetical protein
MPQGHKADMIDILCTVSEDWSTPEGCTAATKQGYGDIRSTESALLGLSVSS